MIDQLRRDVDIFPDETRGGKLVVHGARSANHDPNRPVPMNRRAGAQMRRNDADVLRQGRGAQTRDSPSQTRRTLALRDLVVAERSVATLRDDLRTAGGGVGKAKRQQQKGDEPKGTGNPPRPHARPRQSTERVNVYEGSPTSENEKLSSSSKGAAAAASRSSSK